MWLSPAAIDRAPRVCEEASGFMPTKTAPVTHCNTFLRFTGSSSRAHIGIPSKHNLPPGRRLKSMKKGRPCGSVTSIKANTPRVWLSR